ncbi:hypothetical protein GCM10010384_33450 [Streptomyces djakartensis]|uniref:DUF4131 domain-containing protein n=1 Tax=Streptomyces djakartensis TaxID=68193 RepID=A0ABQ2ZRM4_9ACTN|nr:hypothetical protein GCM10010384_33450 [Streptomyces djakartensis]
MWGGAGGGLVAVGSAALLWDPGQALAWTAGVVAAAAAAYLGQLAPLHLQQALARRRAGRELTEGEPLAVSVDIRNQDYVTLDFGDRVADVPAAGHTVRIVVTSTGPSAVLLTGIRAEVLSRDVLPGDLSRHAAEVPVRRFEALLDADPPEVRALGESDFPYRIAADESEVLDLVASTEHGLVQWVLWLNWMSAGRQGSTRIDLAGRPFHTAARRPGAA